MKRAGHPSAVRHAMKKELRSALPKLFRHKEVEPQALVSVDQPASPAPASANEENSEPGHEQVLRTAGELNQHRVDQLISDKLGGDYRKNSRPIPDSSRFDGSHRIKIFMGLSFRKLLDLNQLKGTLSMVVWLRLMWPDYRLKYNATDYFKDIPMFGEGKHFHWNSSVDFVPVEQNDVWVPDIQILNAVQETQQINHNPRVFWYDENKLKKMGYNMVLVSPEIIHVQCAMNLKHFPFDSQQCEIQFGDWSASERYFEFDTIDRFSQHWTLPETDTEFKFDNATVHTGSVKEDQLVVDAGIPVVIYKLKLSRQPNYYLVKFVLPMFLLVLLGQSLYFMDLEKERFSTGITVILAVMTVAFLTAPLMPKTPEVMWLETFQVGCYVLSCIPLFFSVLLDHVKLKKYCNEEQAERIDASARIIHPIVVTVFYFWLFGIPGFRLPGKHGGFAYWPFEVPELAVFFWANVTIFVTFAVVGLLGLPCCSKYVPKSEE